MPNEVLIDCPFCGKKVIKALHFGSYLQAHVSRISSGAKTTYSRVPDKHKILSDCPECGKSKKDITDRLEGKTQRSHEERIERLRQRGLPLVIESTD